MWSILSSAPSQRLTPWTGYRQQVVDDSGEVAIRQQTVDELPEDTIFRIPWGHHVAIINACPHDSDKTLFYIFLCINTFWRKSIH
jgi:hypothetical protein